VPFLVPIQTKYMPFGQPAMEDPSRDAAPAPAATGAADAAMPVAPVPEDAAVHGQDAPPTAAHE
jgi:hypothetical protein